MRANWRETLRPRSLPVEDLPKSIMKAQLGNKFFMLVHIPKVPCQSNEFGFWYYVMKLHLSFCLCEPCTARTGLTRFQFVSGERKRLTKNKIHLGLKVKLSTCERGADPEMHHVL